MSRTVRLKPAPGLLVVLCLAAGGGVPGAVGQPAKVDSSPTFIAHAEAINANIDQDPLVAWVQPIFEVLDTRFVNGTKPRTVAVEVTLHPEGPAEIVVAARPALAEADTKAICPMHRA